MDTQQRELDMFPSDPSAPAQPSPSLAPWPLYLIIMTTHQVTSVLSLWVEAEAHWG